MTPLSDSQIDIVTAAAAPLSREVRREFLAAVLGKLKTEPTLGDGAVSRACREMLAKFFDPPDLSTGASGRSRWR
jgi:hypothetical protein